VNVSEPVATDEYRLPQVSESGTNVTVSYSLWIGSNITEKRSINITADHNVTFYEIMQRASDLDSAFTYVMQNIYFRCQISMLYTDIVLNTKKKKEKESFIFFLII